MMKTKNRLRKEDLLMPCALLFMHALKLCFYFQDVVFRTGFPFVNTDFIQYYIRVLRSTNLWLASGRIWGYDPFDQAGAITGIFHEVGTYWQTWLAVAASSFLSVEKVMLISEAAGFILSPFAIYLATRQFGGSRRQAWVGFGITVIMTGQFEFLTKNRDAALFGYQMAGYVAVLQISLMFRWLKNFQWRHWSAFTALSCLLFLIHPGIAPVTLAANFFFYIWNARRMPFPSHVALVVTGLLVLLANWHWIHPFFMFREWKETAPYFVTWGWRSFWYHFSPVQPTVRSSFGVVAATTALVLAWKYLWRISSSHPSLARPLMATMAWMFVLNFFGSSLPVVSGLQPSRAIFVFALLSYALAAPELSEAMLAPRRHPFVAGLPVVGIGLFIVFWTGFPVGGLKNTLPEDQQNLLAQLKEKAPRDARVLMQGTDSPWPHIAEAVPAMTGLSVMGGPHPGNFLKTRFQVFKADYVDGLNRDESWQREPVIFEKKLAAISSTTWAGYMDLYNIGTVVALNQKAIVLLDAFTDTLAPAGQAGRYRLYAVKGPKSWFLRGSGSVTLAMDEIRLENVSPGTLVLKFHWIKTLRTDPPLPIRGVFLSDDPVPFIEVDNSEGVTHIRIYQP